MTRQVGIDLGATAVRVVENTGVDQHGVAQITKVSIVPLRPGAIVAGKIMDHSGVAWALTEALKAAKVSPYGPVLSIGSTETALKTLTLPATLTPLEQHKALRVKNHPISPRIPLEQAALALNPLPEYDAEEATHANLLASVATHEALNDVLTVAKLAKVTPKAVDMAAAACLRAVTRTLERNADVATVIDVGATKSTIATRHGRHLRSVRVIDVGADRITRALSAGLDISLAEAEETKHTMRLDNPAYADPAPNDTSQTHTYGSLSAPTPVVAVNTNQVAQEALATSAELLIEELATAVESDAAQHPTHPTQGLQLCGGGALLRGFKEALTRRIGVPSTLVRPWAKIMPNKNTQNFISDGRVDPEVLLSLTTAIGLSLWQGRN